MERIDCLVDGAVEGIGVSEGLMREMLCFEVTPDGLDVVQLRRILGEPLDSEPMGGPASASLLVWIGPLSSTSTTGLVGWPGLGP